MPDERARRNLDLTMTVSDADWQWFDQAQLRLAGDKKIVYREALENLKGLIAKSQRGEILANDVLTFMDPRAQGDVQGFSFVLTLGYFLAQETMGYSSREGADRDKIAELLTNITQKRVDILAALGQENPFIWRRDEAVMLEQSLPNPEAKNPDLIEAYLNAVEELYEYLESLSNVAEVLKFLQLQVVDYQAALDSGKTRKGRVIDERVKRNIRAEMPKLEQAIARLKQKKD